MQYFSLGSPPLARGTASCPKSDKSRARITPACAGNRLYICKCHVKIGDHPRLRGEQEDWTGREIKAMGSPPLARGTGHALGLHIFAEGITPACAGNSLRLRLYLAHRWDHPRLRGEQNRHHREQQQFLGSPPLARGTAYVTNFAMSRTGITPACAGNRTGGLF